MDGRPGPRPPRQAQAARSLWARLAVPRTPTAGEPTLVGPRIRWQASPHLVWTQYDDSDEWVVYNPASADIHLVTASARELWSLTAASPSSAEELTDALAGRLKRPVDDELIAATDDALSFMDKAGLVRPVSS